MKPASIAPARLAAFEVLVQVEQDLSHADDILHGRSLRKLSVRDRALATTLVLGCLRWQLALDAAITPMLRDSHALPLEAWTALRLGLLQLWYLDRIPAHAALSDSVELIKRGGMDGLSGLVNAVLRKVSRQPAPEPSRAALLAHPAWMVDRWRVNFSDAVAEKVCAADQRIPATAMRRSTKQPSQGTPGKLLTAAMLAAGSEQEGDSSSTESRPTDNARIQDEGSQLVAEIAAVAMQNPTRVLDACAAPGGKTAVLAELLPDATITACDISAPRMRTMARLLAAQQWTNIELVKSDAADLPAEAGLFDLILCDVPCSGTGTLGRNPEIRLRLQPAQFAEFAHRQLQIARGCWRHVAPGGAMVYSTCSLEPEENEAVINSLCVAEPDVRVEPVASVLTNLQRANRLTSDGANLLLASAVRGDFLRTIPGIHPCDGFFVALLRKPG